MAWACTDFSKASSLHSIAVNLAALLVSPLTADVALGGGEARCINFSKASILLSIASDLVA